jgi:hypothetical protein
MIIAPFCYSSRIQLTLDFNVDYISRFRLLVKSSKGPTRVRRRGLIKRKKGHSECAVTALEMIQTYSQITNSRNDRILKDGAYISRIIDVAAALRGADSLGTIDHQVGSDPALESCCLYLAYALFNDGLEPGSLNDLQNT